MKNTTNRQIPLFLGSIVICLTALSVTACGRKGDLYLPESPAAVTSSPATQEPAENEKEKEEKQKKEESNSTE